MSTKTRAAVLSGPQTSFTVKDVELGDLREHEVLVRMVATGVCHTDLGVWAGGIPFPLPGVIGHEGAGVVEQVGSAVTTITPGDKVVLSYASCGECPACLHGHPAYCSTWLPRNLFAGAREDGTPTISLDGAPIGGHFFAQSSFAQHAIAEERNVVVVDPDADLTTIAPLGCGVMTGFGSVWNALDVQAGARVAVFGAGAVGLSGVVAAALREPELLIAVDVVPERLDLALELGATHIINGREEDVVARIVEITGGAGLTHAFDTTGVPAVARSGIDALGARGRLVTCGAPPPGTEIPVDFQGILPGKSISGVTMGDADPKSLIPQLVELVASGRFPLGRLTKQYTLDQLDQAVADMHHGTTVKPVIVH
ncbi:MAG TPA: NAD(P)-dependent alcohol dehydrogenase [Cellulomonas sp.]|uniref:NAD(P)-dependent alcohol dehydrogenase n=1 Tax=Cellulomonas sp. TaxID=40001 RepID=UPI002E2F30AB|nr:NAD(P)-dependent alcohol dehydrogenase [Cellulomonas sp.]HEX5332219.1 NAD(P)-dependent alcohol dehydrogenase [Cellulomonas sp.]